MRVWPHARCADGEQRERLKLVRGSRAVPDATEEAELHGEAAEENILEGEEGFAHVVEEG